MLFFPLFYFAYIHFLLLYSCGCVKNKNKIWILSVRWYKINFIQIKNDCVENLEERNIGEWIKEAEGERMWLMIEGIFYGKCSKMVYKNRMKWAAMCIFIFNWGVLVVDGILPSPTTIATTKYYLAAKYYHLRCHRTHNSIAIMIHAIMVIYTQMRKCDMCVGCFILFGFHCLTRCVRVCGHQADRRTF